MEGSGSGSGDGGDPDTTTPPPGQWPSLGKRGQRLLTEEAKVGSPNPEATNENTKGSVDEQFRGP